MDDLSDVKDAVFVYHKLDGKIELRSTNPDYLYVAELLAQTIKLMAECAEKGEFFDKVDGKPVDKFH
jgi:hypothetical protein